MKMDDNKKSKSLRLWARLADQQLSAKEVGITPLHQAAFNGQVNKVKGLLKNGCDVNVRDKYGWTPLHDATIQGHCEIIKILIDAGADINAQDYEDLYTPLHDAARNNNKEIMNILLAEGADTKIVDRSNQTAFDIEKEISK